MRNSSVSVLNVITSRLSREFQYGPRRAAYDLKKLRGKHIVARIGKTPRYEAIPEGLKAMAALIMLREKAIKPLLAAAKHPRRSRRPSNSNSDRRSLLHDSSCDAGGIPRTRPRCLILTIFLFQIGRLIKAEKITAGWLQHDICCRNGL